MSVIKISNYLLVPSEPEQSCIYCSRCADPIRPAFCRSTLYRLNHDKSTIRPAVPPDCIECGACAYVCLSNIPLVQYYRQQKAGIRTLNDARSAGQSAL
ncbi:hypothetical protein [Sodalis sp.]|uniref:hypothetical protein n=1 Tax=Sodalis sp. (in: enterobacteria) TaxID=1898979 RepID=UPI003873686C